MVWIGGGRAMKVPKDKANYRMTSSTNKRCGTCEHYISPNRCSIVLGTISANDVSDYYAPKARVSPRVSGS